MTAPPPETIVVYRDSAPRSSAAVGFVLGFITCGILVWILASWPVVASDDIGNTPVVIQMTTPAQPQTGTVHRHPVTTTGSVSGCHYTNPYIDEYVQHPPC